MINIFNWLAWDNKILTLENLILRRCNLLRTATCVMCHAYIETNDHLLLLWLGVSYIWNYFGHFFGGWGSFKNLKGLWGNWRMNVAKSLICFWDLLLVKAITLNIWLERNAYMFTSICLSTGLIIQKIDRMILIWFSTAPKAKKIKNLEELMF